MPTSVPDARPVGLYRSDHRCVAPDLRGFGDSDAPRTGYAVADSADDGAGAV